jgi:hypothetical protein
MKPITEKTVREAWREVSRYDPKQAEMSMDRLSTRQPALVSFVLEFCQDLSPHAKGLGLHLLLAVYRPFARGFASKLGEIPPGEIVECYE